MSANKVEILIQTNGKLQSCSVFIGLSAGGLHGGMQVVLQY